MILQCQFFVAVNDVLGHLTSSRKCIWALEELYWKIVVLGNKISLYFFYSFFFKISLIFNYWTKSLIFNGGKCIMSMNGNENISQPIEADIFHQMTISTTPKIIILKKRKKERKMVKWIYILCNIFHFHIFRHLD